MTETMEITKLTNGFVVKINTRFVKDEYSYVPTFKGVVAKLYLAYEGKAKLNKDQASFIKELAEKNVKVVPHQSS